MARTRVYLSFDLENDEDLHDELLEQQSQAAFEIEAETQRGELNPRWSSRARRSIADVDEVLFLCGRHTDSSPRMSAELRIAQEEGKPYLLLWGRRESMCKMPVGVRSGDAMYQWTPAALDEQLATMLRKARPMTIPEAAKHAS